VGGEAKRRSALLGSEISGVRIDPRSGKAVAPVRFGGSITAALAQPGKVPCGACVACCYHPFIGVQPENERPEDLAHLDLVTRKGRMARSRCVSAPMALVFISGSGAAPSTRTARGAAVFTTVATVRWSACSIASTMIAHLRDGTSLAGRRNRAL
jgi:hypothetical protein